MLVALASFACSRAPAHEDLGALDLVAASSRIDAMVTDCAGARRALATLAASRLSARALLGLVDETVELARERCAALDAALRGTHAVHHLARAELAATPEDALRALGDVQHPAVSLQRSLLLDALDRPAEALAELARVPGADASEQRALEVAALAKAGVIDRAAALVAAAPAEARTSLANRLVAHAPASRIGALATSPTLDIAIAAGNRLEALHGPAAALAARRHAAALAPDDADLQAALAVSLAAANRLDDALAAWDRAAAIAPAQPAFRLAPLRALVAANDHERARTRAAQLADEARAHSEPELLVTASHAAVIAGEPARGVTLVQLARERSPRDGRLAFELALRHLDAGDRAAAIEAFAELLVCGAHGKPWHRHELAGKLVLLATDASSRQAIRRALAKPRACTPADAADLATYVTQLEQKLD